MRSAIFIVADRLKLLRPLLAAIVLLNIKRIMRLRLLVVHLIVVVVAVVPVAGVNVGRSVTVASIRPVVGKVDVARVVPTTPVQRVVAASTTSRIGAVFD
jgi:hypothetical protein